MRVKRRWVYLAALALCAAAAVLAHLKYRSVPRPGGDANGVEAKIEWRGFDSNYAATTVYHGDGAPADQKK